MAEVPATPRQYIQAGAVEPHVTASTSIALLIRSLACRAFRLISLTAALACSALHLKQSQSCCSGRGLAVNCSQELLTHHKHVPLAAVTSGPPFPFLNILPYLQDLLTRHKAMVAVYLSEHYRSFFQDYSKLLQSSNYVTRRQSLKVSLLHISLTKCGCHLLSGQNMHQPLRPTHVCSCLASSCWSGRM